MVNNMKKLLASLLLFVPIAVMADDYGITVPEWKDFAPQAFIDVKAPKGLGKLNVTAKYWYDRKVAFDESIAECSEFEAANDRFDCYEKVKARQYALNSEYNARLEAQNNPQIQEMRNPTDNMLPIGNYIDAMTRNMPNEFR